MSAAPATPLATPAEPVEQIELSRPGGLTVTVIADHGARISRLTDSRGVQWLAGTGAAELPATTPTLFANGTRGGWDECLPSVSTCDDPNRPGVAIADHGDFWARPWTVTQTDDHSVTMSAAIPGHPLRATKTVTLAGGAEKLRVDVQLRNHSDHPYAFLYSAHPLWAFTRDAHLDLPGAGEFITAFGPGWSDPKTAYWPNLPTGSGARQDLSDIPLRGELINYKVFVRWSGTARLEFPDLGSALLLQQRPDTAPWLGVCINRGAYPSRAGGDHWIALEPTNAPTDSLVTAVGLGSAQVLQAAATACFTSQIQIQHSEPAAS